MTRARLALSIAPMAAILLLAAGAAEAALTTELCLAKKRRAWSTLRKCQAAEDVKRFRGKPADPVKCQTQFQEKLAKIDAKAAQATIACRYGDNGDETVTDYDTGLMWEKKNGIFGGFCILIPDEPSHCVNDLGNWVPALELVAGTSGDDLVVRPYLAGYTDWRLPTIAELRGILDTGAPGCGSGSPCIDPTFGSTAPRTYYSSTSNTDDPNGVWCLTFSDGMVNNCFKGGLFYHRAVRSGL
jgi:hypothetical protein